MQVILLICKRKLNTRFTKHHHISNDINSSISINGPTATKSYGTATYFTGTETASTMDSKLIPTALDASLMEIYYNIEKYIGAAG